VQWTVKSQLQFRQTQTRERDRYSTHSNVHTNTHKIKGAQVLSQEAQRYRGRQRVLWY